MENEITPEVDTPIVDSTEADSEGKEQAPESTEKESGGRDLNPEEMQKTLNKQFNEIDQLKKQLEKPEAPKTEPEGVDLSSKIENLEKQLNDSNFYAENPEYKAYQALIGKLGDSPSEVIKSEEFKTVYDSASAYDKLQSSKSVLESNSRLGQVTDKMSKAREELKAGNDAVAGDEATKAVLDAFGIK